LRIFSDKEQRRNKMKIAIIIGFFAAGIFAGVRIYQLWKIVKHLRLQIAAQVEKIDWYSQEQERYLGGDLSIELLLTDRRLILNALEFPAYKALFSNPKTKYTVREIYNLLRTKMKDSIKGGTR